jgi:hypothetical protein
MSTPSLHAKRPRAARILLASLALLCAAAPPAAAQRRENPIFRLVRTALAQLERVATDDTPVEEGPPASLRPCGSLYNAQITRIARGPELVRSHVRWLNESYATIREFGPIPVCFDYGKDTLVTNQGRYLVDVNNDFLQRRPHGGYVLTGHTDPAEADPALAGRRAEFIQTQSPLPACRYVVRRNPSPDVPMAQYRRVVYSLQPAAARCPRPPR